MANDLGSLLGGAVDPYQAALRKAQANTAGIARRRRYDQGIEPEFSLADAFTQAPPGLRPESISASPDESWRSAAGRYAGQGISALTGKAPSEASQDVQTGLALTDFLPVLGDAQGYADVYDDAKAGDWTSAAMDLAAAILPVVPSAAGRIRRKAKSGDAVRAIDEALGNTPDTGAGLAPASEGRAPTTAAEDDYVPESAAPVLSEATQSPPSAKKGVKAYHGSPHSFDKFSMDKIGTGEGAQAYGHGLYFAENEGVARDYRDKLSRLVGDTQTPLGALDRALGMANGDRAVARKSLENEAKAFAKWNSPRVAEYEEAIRLLDEGHSGGGSMYEVSINADPEDFLDWDKPLSEQSEKVRGVVAQMPEDRKWPRSMNSDEFRRMYVEPVTKAAAGTQWESVLNNPTIINDLLQAGPEKSAAFINEVRRDSPAAAQKIEDFVSLYEQPTGDDIYRSLATSPYDSASTASFIKAPGGAATAASERLKQAGIPGIKYLDAGSRAPKTLFDGKPIGNDNLAAQVAAESLDLHGSPEAAIKALSANPGYRGSNAEAAELLRSGRVSRTVPAGSRNYVVFDDKIIDIVRKYGIVGALGMGMITQEMAEQMRAQGVEG